MNMTEYKTCRWCDNIIPAKNEGRAPNHGLLIREQARDVFVVDGDSVKTGQFQLCLGSRTKLTDPE